MRTLRKLIVTIKNIISLIVGLVVTSLVISVVLLSLVPTKSEVASTMSTIKSTATDVATNVVDKTNNKNNKVYKSQSHSQKHTLVSYKKVAKPKNNAPIVTVASNQRTNKITKKDLYLLAKIIHCEYSSQRVEDFDKKLAVGLVVLNRVKSNKFPNSIEEVIFQRNQFQPTFDGSWEKKEPTEYDYKIAFKAIEEYGLKGDSGKYINTALYFMNPDVSEKDNVEWFRKNLIYLDTVGEHEFYTEKSFLY